MAWSMGEVGKFDPTTGKAELRDYYRCTVGFQHMPIGIAPGLVGTHIMGRVVPVIVPAKPILTIANQTPGLEIRRG